MLRGLGQEVKLQVHSDSSAGRAQCYRVGAGALKARADEVLLYSTDGVGEKIGDREGVGFGQPGGLGDKRSCAKST